MPLVPMRLLLDHAAENNYGLAAFNVNNMEQIQAIMQAAEETTSPVIIQASRGARAYSNDLYLRNLMLAAAELHPRIPITMHLDHGNSEATCASAIRLGFTSVMMDGSLLEDGKTPADYDYNVKVTKAVCQLAHQAGVSVEGELGVLGSLATGHGEKEDGHGAEGKLSKEQMLTNPEEAARFVAETGVDALAVAIGTSHGAYKFSQKPTGEVLSMETIEKIHRKIPNCHLVMHGSSSVPQSLQDKINRYGGKIKPTWGVPVEEIQRGIKNGVRKINVDTDCRLAITGAIREVFAESPEKFDPRDYLKPARTAMQEICKERMVAFGQAGWADKIKIITLEEMKKRYY
ncbi:MAG TPA: fructose-bisphosphate aldolase class II [Oligoflexia bacterium]|nr:fructose-bisphosphate aldolase class II [Oligoflexia bacterium]HMP27108.1 fructose-bisphosphate aldolase class II [Oligoflexia bacterium]